MIVPFPRWEGKKNKTHITNICSQKNPTNSYFDHLYRYLSICMFAYVYIYTFLSLSGPISLTRECFMSPLELWLVIVLIRILASSFSGFSCWRGIWLAFLAPGGQNMIKSYTDRFWHINNFFLIIGTIQIWKKVFWE